MQVKKDLSSVNILSYLNTDILKNKRGAFIDITATSGIDTNRGSWNCIIDGDFDNDGDIDYVAGNLGTNSFYKQTINILFRYMQTIFINRVPLNV